MSLPTHSAAQTRGGTTINRSESLELSVRRELDAVIGEYQRGAASYSPSTAILWDRIGAALEGGKLTRPRLAMLGHEAFGGRDTGRAVTLGCAFELLHGSLLMHDDVIDRDFTRRGRPTLSARYRAEALASGRSPADAEHAGHAAAIIAGDLLLAASIRLAGKAAASLPAAAAIENAFHQGIHNAGAGELEDLLFSLSASPAKVQEVLRMEELKTAAYSFQAPLQAGALLAGAGAEDAAALGDIGSQLGVAYQLIDDVLGTFGNPAFTGKSIESDLREGKSTILTAMASTTPAFAANLQLFREHRTDVATLRQSLQRTGAESFARQLAEELCHGATQSAHQLRLPAQVSAALEDFASLILHRGA